MFCTKIPLSAGACSDCHNSVLYELWYVQPSIPLLSLLFFRKLLTVCVEECRLESILQASVDTSDTATDASTHTASSHRQNSIPSWLSVLKVNGRTVLIASTCWCNMLIAVVKYQIFCSGRIWSNLFVFVRPHDNSWTIRDIITTFSGHHPMVERDAKFKNGYICVHDWWFNVSDVP